MARASHVDRHHDAGLYSRANPSIDPHETYSAAGVRVPGSVLAAALICGFRAAKTQPVISVRAPIPKAPAKAAFTSVAKWALQAIRKCTKRSND